MRIISYNYIVFIFTILIIMSCGNKENRSENKEYHKEEKVTLNKLQIEALKMKIDTLALRNMSGYVEANGTLGVPPQNEAAITTVVGANILSIKVIEGEKVEKGQVVAYLSHPNIISLQTDYLNAYNNRELSKKSFDRQKKLYEAGVGSGANFQKAEAEYNVSSALVNGLAAQLKILNINSESVQNGSIAQQIPLLSPIDGFVKTVEVKTGQYVEPKTELFEIVNTNHVHADLMVFEKDVHKVKKGQKVTFSVQSIPDAELTAVIYSISKTFEDNPKAVHVHAEIENKSGNLIPGMYIQGKIETDTVLTKALPENAIVKDGDRIIVFAVEIEEENWTFKPIEVITGEKDDNWIAISFTEELPTKTKFAINNAYYLIAEMKKEAAEHAH